jgi:hypothetical protein
VLGSTAGVGVFVFLFTGTGGSALPPFIWRRRIPVLPECFFSDEQKPCIPFAAGSTISSPLAQATGRGKAEIVSDRCSGT